MRRKLFFPGVAAFAATAALSLAGCGKGEDPGLSVGNLFAPRATTAPPIPVAYKTLDIDCPIVQIPENGNAYRVYSGADKSNASVRYQFSLGEVSRDCSGDNTHIDFRLGISGYVQAGPAGGPGSYAVPLKIMVRRESDQQEAATKTYRIEATIPPGEDQAVFSLVTEPISVPFISKAADEDYGLYVGFDATPEKPQKPEPRRRSRR